jgi:hypothetical protein
MNDVGLLLITTAVLLVAGGVAGWWSAVLRQREPLRSLFEDIEPGTKRWRRLQRTKKALDALAGECRAVLRLPGATPPDQRTTLENAS